MYQYDRGTIKFAIAKVSGGFRVTGIAAAGACSYPADYPGPECFCASLLQARLVMEDLLKGWLQAIDPDVDAPTLWQGSGTAP